MADTASAPDQGRWVFLKSLQDVAKESVAFN